MCGELDGGLRHILPEGKPDGVLIVKDAIADAFLQQILLRPAEYDVSAPLNLNGDYLADALAAQVGGIGIAPGASINYVTSHAVFEANRGVSPLRRSALRQGQDDLCEQIAAERDDQVRDADRVSSRRTG